MTSTPVYHVQSCPGTVNKMLPILVSAGDFVNPKVVVTPSSPRHDVAKEDAVEELNDFAVRFGVLFRAANIFGGLPIRKTDDGWRFDIRTREFAFSVLIYVPLFVLFSHVISVLYVRNDQFSGTRNEFHKSVFNHMFIGLLIMYLLVPITTWMDSAGIAAYVNEWNDYQELFLCTTGRRLRVKDTRMTQLMVAVGMTGLIGAGLLLFGPPELEIWQRLPHLVSVVFSALSVAYWILCCDAVIEAAAQLNGSFTDGMRTCDAPRRRLRDYRRLWLALSRLSSNTAASLARTSSVFTLTELYLILVAVHGLLSCLLGVHPSSDAVAPYLIATAVAVTAFYVFCNMGHCVTQKVGGGILNELNCLNTPEYDCTTVREVNLFFQSVAANPPILSIGGFVTVNRGLFKSCCATILTYLVVIVQFEMGLSLSDVDPTSIPAARSATASESTP